MIKSIDITGSEIMVEPTGKANEECGASISERFLEKLLGKSILKSTESQHNHKNQMIMNHGKIRLF